MATVEGASHIVRYVNPAFCRLLKKTSKQLLGKQFREIMPEKDICVTLLDRVFRTGTSESHTEQEHSKPHPVFWSYTMWPVITDQHTVGVMIQVTETAQFHEKTLAMNEALILGSVRQHELTEAADSSNALLQTEIGERKLVEKSLNLAQAQLTDRAGQLQGLVTERTSELTATNNQLEAFVYSIAHDLRAPLRSMRGFSAMLVEEAGASLSEAARDYANRILKSAEFMDDLLGDLLAFSRISQQHVELTPIELEPIVAAVLSRLEPDIQEKHARVESSGPWPVVLAHERTIAQVLFNLASNALKFTLPGVPPQIRIRAEVPTNPAFQNSNIPPGESPAVRVWVEDNGPGFAPEHREEIFRLFTRLHGAQYPGTGIGLAIVQKGVERMGGRVGVESEPGKGARFWFELKQPETVGPSP
jgi:signal transduction histidine kinase